MIKEFKCSNCDKYLATVTGTDCGYLKKIRFSCPFCFDQSYQQEITGHYSILPADGVSILDLADNDEPDTLVLVYLTEE